MTDFRDAPPSVAPDLTPAATQPGGLVRFCARHFTLLLCLVLALAAFNLTFRLGQEYLTEWDESLYATTAIEALQGGHWIGTTFQGELDYYNTKPPLNVWLIALAMNTLGPDLVALRIVSATAAWLTVLALMLWTRRTLGPAIGLVAGVVLATSFGFLHIHSGRSANTDAIFTLLVVLTAIVLWAEPSKPWARTWHGPILAATFLLRGMAVLMPLLVICGVWVLARKRPTRWLAPSLVAALLFVVPVGGWMLARFQVDRWAFLNRLFFYDFVARTAGVIEDHPGGPFFYLNILQKHQFDWLLAAAVALVVAPISWRSIRSGWRTWRTNHTAVVLSVLAAVTLIEPTVMRTKLPWYLNTFYPVFAVGVSWLVLRALAIGARVPQSWRPRLVAVAAVVAFGVAEGKLVWYSFAYRDLSLSDQSLVLAEMSRLSGQRLFRNQDDRAGAFVTTSVAGASARHTDNAESFLRDSQKGDYLLVPNNIESPSLECVRSNGKFWLYLRVRD